MYIFYMLLPYVWIYKYIRIRCGYVSATVPIDSIGTGGISEAYPSGTVTSATVSHAPASADPPLGLVVRDHKTQSSIDRHEITIGSMWWTCPR